MAVSLTLPQSLYTLSEDDVINLWAEDLYWQYLYGETFFQHRSRVKTGLKVLKIKNILSHVPYLVI